MVWFLGQPRPTELTVTMELSCVCAIVLFSPVVTSHLWLLTTGSMLESLRTEVLILFNSNWLKLQFKDHLWPVATVLNHAVLYNEFSSS